MHAFSQLASLEILDGCACGLLAAAAVCRARNYGVHYTGSIVLGCFAGIIGGLAREFLLHGPAGAKLALSALPADALIGALGALLAMRILKRGGLFFWLDSAGFGLATSLGCVLALPELDLIGALLVGLINGLLPGFARDVSLGDAAMMVEQNWYATSAALGGMTALCILLLPIVFDAQFVRVGEWATLGGLAATLLVRYLKGDRLI